MTRPPSKEEARRVLLDALGSLGSPDEDDVPWGGRFGRIRHLGEGLSYHAYMAGRETGHGPDLVVRLPKADAMTGGGEAADREAALLRRLAEVELPFRIPAVVATAPTAAGTALVQELLYGIPLPAKAATSAIPPWEVVAEAAAAIHDVDPEPLATVVPAFPTRRDHALRQIRVLEEADLPEADAARDWALAHLPPADPARLVHGDLLGQNILVPLERLERAAGMSGSSATGGEPPPLGILDWSEAVIGDPAYDLAIVTRGARRPFGESAGLDRLLDAYGRRARRPIPRSEVILHELVLMTGFYLQSVRDAGEESPRAVDRRRGLAGLLRRAERLATS